VENETVYAVVGAKAYTGFSFGGRTGLSTIYTYAGKGVGEKGRMERSKNVGEP